MRGWWVLTVLALAGCGENQGWNPNYQFGGDDYGRYLTAREAALVTGAVPARTIPVARPLYAPTGAQIAGQDPVPVPPSMGLRVLRPTTVPAAGAAPMMNPVTATTPAPAPVTIPVTRPDRRGLPGQPIRITPADMSL